MCTNRKKVKIDNNSASINVAYIVKNYMHAFYVLSTFHE